jgi:hypothetical protein
MGGRAKCPRYVYARGARPAELDGHEESGFRCHLFCHGFRETVQVPVGSFDGSS